MKKKKLSIILPSYNEERNIKDTFNTVIKSLNKSLIYNFEIIFVDDGSKDLTTNIIKKIIFENHKRINIKNKFFSKNYGLGRAFKVGSKLATGSHVMFIPTDNYHPYKGLADIFKNMKWDNSILISFVKNTNQRSLFRRIISKTYTYMLNILFKNKIKYFNGLNIYPKKILSKNINKTYGFSFQTEIIIKAIKNGCDYYHVPTILRQRKESFTNAFRFKNIYQVFTSILKLYFS